MNSKRPWIIAGTAAIALAGFGTAVAAASDDDSPVRGRQDTPVVQQYEQGAGPVVDSAQTADSPNVAPVPVPPAASADSPDNAKAAPQPVKAKPAKVTKQAPPRKAPVADSANSGNSADSAD